MTILSGSKTAIDATLITIPAGHIWQGSLAISLGSDANSSAWITVTDGGVGVSPPAGTDLAGTCVKVPALGVGNNSVSISDVCVKAGDSDAKLKLRYSGSGTPILYANAMGAY